MKKNKIIGIAVASLGVVVSISLAAALYVKTASNTGFGIGAGSFTGSTGAVTYKVNNATSGAAAPKYVSHDGTSDTGTGLVYVEGDEAKTYDQVHYEFVLSAEYASGLNVQDYVTGNLAISITNIPAAYQGKLSIWAEIEGYTANTLGAHYYQHVFMNSDYAITSSATSFVENHDVAVATAGTQKLSIYLKYDLSTFDLLTQDEAGLDYTLSVTWGEASASFGRAYVVGAGNQWTQDDEFVMAPNINKAHSEGWEWIYNNLPGTMIEAKCNKGSGESLVWSNGSNASLTSGSTYNVYWNGEASGAASFAAI